MREEDRRAEVGTWWSALVLWVLLASMRRRRQTYGVDPIRAADRARSGWRTLRGRDSPVQTFVLQSQLDDALRRSAEGDAVPVGDGRACGPVQGGR